MWGDYGGDSHALIYQNGNAISEPIKVKLSKRMKDIKKQVIPHFNFPSTCKFRLFDEKGVEIFEDDLEYVQDEAILYASKGTDFDSNSALNEYQILSHLGEGAYGQVKLGLHKMTQEKVAIKVINASHINSVQEVEQVYREAEVMESLEHPYIVKIKRCLFTKTQVLLVMEYMDGGELYKKLEESKQFTEEVAKNYFRQIALAIEYCHNNNLIHRDLKLENILLTGDDQNICKVADFGIAGMATNVDTDNLDLGTLQYMPPEVVSGDLKTPSQAVDIWALGVIAYTMLFGSLPFYSNNNHEVKEKIIRGKFKITNEMRNQVSPEALDLIEQCLELDYQKRIPIGKLVQHQWIKDDTLEKLIQKSNQTRSENEEEGEENSDNQNKEENEEKKEDSVRKVTFSSQQQQQQKGVKIQGLKSLDDSVKSKTSSGPRYAQSTKSSNFSQKIKVSTPNGQTSQSKGTKSSSQQKTTITSKFQQKK
ncbi:Protein kinase-like domain [Pseudocohnilembus persalinus]|uniref:Protein kinase-like domain n=1 Tax=Pseudocohnilembus persalinus TaxID=266149 RepID=A0A0V0QKS8_PSEPJ|nr:Protein kinase-like domain [Pseudocohnilembus persalinus]|eukprot:KRX02915.1 Protein kinase-like domain [Pseudocohnilembus persalinus]